MFFFCFPKTAQNDISKIIEEENWIKKHFKWKKIQLKSNVSIENITVKEKNYVIP